ncbi:ZIP family metal transporter [Candidatus Pacearchaeota archaeon]|nr:ZIP family metal transporter [Candidatus Pacearchaeota archaeon]
MESVWLYSIASVFIVSLIAIIGIFGLAIKADKLKKFLIYLISFSAGALFGDAFIHLIPEIAEEGFALSYSIYIILGILIFFSLEKFIHWRHCHMPTTSHHVHPFAYMNLIGDSLHNFIDGLIIAASYIVSIPAGIATTIAVVLHEIPQEIGDFGVLLYAGFSKGKAIFLNFVTALAAVIGAVVSLLLNRFVENIEIPLICLAVGGFLYIAGSDLIPELHKETRIGVSLMQIISFIIGVAVMALLLLLE